MSLKADHWTLFWTAMTPIVTLATVFALALAAYFAKGQMDTTRESSRIELTNSVLNSDWVNYGIDALANYTQKKGAGNWETARTALEIDLKNQRQGNAPDVEFGALQQHTQASYVYLSRLYNRGVLDNKLAVESASALVVQGLFIMEPLLTAYIHVGALDDDILAFGRACLDRFRKRPEILVAYPFLRDWKP